jgi:hypothetical protein
METLMMRFVKLALALIIAVNGILLTPASPANAAAPCGDSIHSVSPSPWDSRNDVTFTGTVAGEGQQVTIQAVDQTSGNYVNVGTVTSTGNTTVIPCHKPTGWVGVDGFLWSFKGFFLQNYWAPQFIADSQAKLVPNLGSSQGHLEIRALDAGGRLIGQSTVFDPYGVNYGPETVGGGPFGWVPVAGGYLVSPSGNYDNVAFSVGQYAVEGGKTIYGLICEPADGPIPGPYPIVIYNHGGFNYGPAADIGSFDGTVNQDGSASTNNTDTADALKLCVDWAKRGWIVALSTYRAESVTITSHDPAIAGGIWNADATGEIREGEYCLGEVTDVLALTDLLVHHASSIAVGAFAAWVPLNPDVGKVLMVGYSHGGCITYRAVEQGAPVTAFSVIEGIADQNLGYLNCLASGQTKEFCAFKDSYSGQPFGYYYPGPPDSTGVMGYNWRSPHYFASRGDLSGPKFQTMPILIFHGDHDQTVELDQAIMLANDIQATNFFVRPDKNVPVRTNTPCIKPVGQPDPVATTCPISPAFTVSEDSCTNQEPLSKCNAVAGATGQGHYFVVYANGDHTNWPLAIKNTFNQFVESNFKKTPGCNALELDCESG